MTESHAINHRESMPSVAAAAVSDTSEAMASVGCETFHLLTFGGFVTKLAELGAVPALSDNLDVVRLTMKDLIGIAGARFDDLIDSPNLIEPDDADIWVRTTERARLEWLEMTNEEHWRVRIGDLMRNDRHQDKLAAMIAAQQKVVDSYLDGSVISTSVTGWGIQPEAREKTKLAALKQSTYMVNLRDFVDTIQDSQYFRDAPEALQYDMFQRLGARLVNDDIAIVPHLDWLLSEEDRELFEYGEQAMQLHNAWLSEAQVHDISTVFSQAYFETAEGKALLQSPGPVKQAFYH